MTVADQDHSIEQPHNHHDGEEEEEELPIQLGLNRSLSCPPSKDKSVRWKEDLIQVHEIPVEGKGISVLEFRKQLDVTKARVKRNGELRDLKEYFSETKSEENPTVRIGGGNSRPKSYSADDVMMMMNSTSSSSLAPLLPVVEDEQEESLSRSLNSSEMMTPPLSKRHRKSGSSPKEARPMFGFHPRDEISTLEYSFKLVTIDSNNNNASPKSTLNAMFSPMEAEKKKDEEEVMTRVKIDSVSASDIDTGTLSVSSEELSSSLQSNVKSSSRRRRTRRKNPIARDSINDNEEEAMRAQMLSRMPAFLRGYGTIR